MNRFESAAIQIVLLVGSMAAFGLAAVGFFG